MIASTQKKPVSDYLLSVRKFQFLASLRYNEDGFIFLLLEEETAGCQTGESSNVQRIVYYVGLIQHASLHCNHVYFISYTQYDLVRKPLTLDALIGYFTPSHVIHQRLLLQFLSAPEDGRKKSPKHVEYYCSY